MKPQTLSRAHARRLAVRAQGLAEPDPFGTLKRGTLSAIEHLGYVQIDTISVVERAHHHILWSRVSNYRPQELHELQAKDRKVFEYWDHAASYLPVSHFRFSLPRMHAIASGKRHWFARKPRVMGYVLDRIKAEGPLQARDFEAPKGHRGGSWFEWKPAKRALDQLYMEGALMIAERRGFQKVYDLTERVLPSGTDLTMPRSEELARFLILRTLKAHGLAQESEIRYLKKSLRKPLAPALAALVEAREIVRIRVEGLPELDYFALPDALESSAHSIASRAHILSPFDSLVIQRKRLQTLFAFDYQIECYVPAPKRKYGYFCLPILFGEKLVGRVDLKADRRSKTLLVQALHLEPGAPKGESFRDAIQAELKRFASFNACEEVAYRPAIK